MTTRIYQSLFSTENLEIKFIYKQGPKCKNRFLLPWSNSCAQGDGGTWSTSREHDAGQGAGSVEVVGWRAEGLTTGDAPGFGHQWRQARRRAPAASSRQGEEEDGGGLAAGEGEEQGLNQF
jgi:hypothetical protein